MEWYQSHSQQMPWRWLPIYRARRLLCALISKKRKKVIIYGSSTRKQNLAKAPIAPAHGMRNYCPAAKPLVNAFCISLNLWQTRCSISVSTFRQNGVRLHMLIEHTTADKYNQYMDFAPCGLKRNNSVTPILNGQYSWTSMCLYLNTSYIVSSWCVKLPQKIQPHVVWKCAEFLCEKTCTFWFWRKLLINVSSLRWRTWGSGVQVSRIHLMQYRAFVDRDNIIANHKVR